VIERQYKQVPGVADDSGFGGAVMQYQVLLDPAKLYAYHTTVPTVVQQLSVNNSNAGGGFVQLTIDTVEHNMITGMILVLIVLMCFLVSLRAAGRSDRDRRS